MKQAVYILVGAPGSGKSWVSRQLSEKFHYVPHDTHGLNGFPQFATKIAKAADDSDKPILCDTPFSLTQLKEPLERAGYTVHPIFIIETPEITKTRYETRDKKPIPKGHLTRITTYFERAKELKAPHGTSDEMLKYLRDLKV